jgi:DNA repair exonuclease SbcCD nuclease subunit
LSIFATADVHLGMKFSAYEDARDALVEARFQTLARCVDEANARSADLFVVAGDLFDRVRVSRADVERGAGILANFEGAAVLVLPGNHDYVRAGVDTLWGGFRDSSGDRTVLLWEPRVYDLTAYDLPIRVYAAPCDSKHSPTNRLPAATTPGPAGNESPAATAATPGAAAAVNPAAAPGAGSAPGLVTLGVGHGSIAGLTLDAEGHYFPMTKQELGAVGLNLWIVGHTHQQHFDPSVPLVIPGTPEPDGFDCTHEGIAALVTIEVDQSDQDRTAASSPGIEIERITVGRNRFVESRVRLDPATDLAPQLQPGTDRHHTVARVIASAVLPEGSYDEYMRLRPSLSHDYLSYDLRDDDVHRELTQSDIDARYPESSFPHQLLSELRSDGDSAALDEAQRLLDEARQ